ncbi:MAG: hypothetical protein CR997_02810 [Acidobacteria bacterium]|nr:MAG: hypothetical protein CR997_02810 [Acidobacteriota bacterium]
MNRPCLFITDCHVSEQNGNVNAFFEMLDLVQNLDVDLVFLGDIFDLWIGFSRYQTSFHTNFLNWCKQEKRKRMIGFIEGNHEFFIKSKYGDCFSWCSEKGYCLRGLQLSHGDLVNREDENYLKFRRLTKNKLTRLLVSVIPKGPFLVEKLKVRMNQKGNYSQYRFPVDAIESFADQSKFGQGVIFGHFHHERSWKTRKGVKIWSLPAWLDDGKIGVLIYRQNKPHLETLTWSDLPSFLDP